MKIFNLPDLGEGLPDAEIHQWFVKEGDEIKADEPLVSMETAKAVVDVPAPRGGRIAKLYGQPGDIIKTGAPLVEFADDNNAVEEPKSSAATVAGAIEVGSTVIEEAAAGITPAQTAISKVKAIPAVRALAKKLQVNLETITPSGPNGQITEGDVKNAAAAKGPEEAVVKTAADSRVEALRGVRRAMANAMVKSHAEVVPVTLMDDADIHAWDENTDITWRVIRAIVAGCQAEPALNAHFDFRKLERKLFSAVNIGIAMDSQEGLFVPVLKHAETLDQPGCRSHINRFKEQVKHRSIPQEDLQGSTIQLSNFGTFAGRYANPIIVPPTVAILGTGKIREQAVAVTGMIAVHRVLPLSLTIDHRAITGGEAARFLQAVIENLEQTG